MTGWRIGYAGGPVPLIRQIATLQSQCTSCPCSISQAAAVAALDGPQGIVAANARVFQQRRDMLVSKVNAIPGLTCQSPHGAFYVYPSCRGLIGKRTSCGTQLVTDADVAFYLLESANVAIVHGAVYGLSPHLRLSFALPSDRLEQACERIARACAALT